MIRPYLVAGGAMGWTPEQVRRATIHDFSAALEGWQLARGVPVDEAPGDEDLARLDALMERYPDG